MKSNAILVAALVASAFVVGFASVGAGSTPVGAEPASVADQSSNALGGTGDAAGLQDDGGGDDGGGDDGGNDVQGNNVTVESLNVTNVTLRNVYVNRLVANATHDGEDETVELRNVSVAEVQVSSGSLRNLTFDTVGMNQPFATDLLGEVGAGVDPEDRIPPQPMQGRNLSDRTITGIEFGQLDVSSASLQNVTVEDGSADAPTDISNGTVSGQGVTVEDASATDVTVVGWSAGLDESDQTTENGS